MLIHSHSKWRKEAIVVAVIVVAAESGVVVRTWGKMDRLKRDLAHGIDRT